jgi:hypothetical protein
MRENRDVLRTKACEHINFADFPSHCRDKLLDEFVPPPLVKRTFVEADSEQETVKESEEISLSESLAEGSNILVIGERQSGRTSLAFYIANQIAKGIKCHPSIPVYIDLRDYTMNYYGIRRAISKFYDGIPAGFELEHAVGNGLFTFILDNLDVYDEPSLKVLADHIEMFNKNRWILFAAPPVESVSKDRLFNEAFPEFEKLHIRPLRRGASQSDKHLT